MAEPSTVWRVKPDAGPDEVARVSPDPHAPLRRPDNTPEGSEATQLRLPAVDTSGATIMWGMDLEPGQHIEQWGRHLVAMGNDGQTIHGLGKVR